MIAFAAALAGAWGCADVLGVDFGSARPLDVAGDAGPDAGDDDPPIGTALHTGAFDLGVDPEAPFTFAAALFTKDVTWPCAKQAVAGTSCVVRQCSPGRGTLVTAEGLRVRGARADIALSRTDGGAPNYWFDREAALFDPGEPLSVEGDRIDGAARPFRVALRLPGRLELLEPSHTGDAPFELDRAAPLAIAWRTAGALPSGRVEVFLSSGVRQLPSPGRGPETEPQTGLQCLFDAAAGQAEIPPIALGTLPSTDAGSIGIKLRDERVIWVDGWRLEVRANGVGGFAAALKTK